MKRWVRILVFLMLLILLLPAFASARSRGREELVVLNLDEAGSETFEQHSAFQARWIQVTATIQGTQDVTLHVVLDENHMADEKDRIVYKRTTKKVKEDYLSPEIFLDFRGSKIEPYRIDLIVDGAVMKSAYIHRMLLNLKGNTVCLRGLRFRDVDAGLTDKWYTFHPIHLTNVTDGLAIDLVGSNMYLVGQVIIHREGENVMFEIKDYDELAESLDGSAYEADECSTCVSVTDHDITFSDMRIGLYHKLSSITSVERSAISKKIGFDRWYNLRDIGAQGTVILYLNGRISYNPNGLHRVNAVVNEGHLQNLLGSFAY